MTRKYVVSVETIYKSSGSEFLSVQDVFLDREEGKEEFENMAERCALNYVRQGVSFNFERLSRKCTVETDDRIDIIKFQSTRRFVRDNYAEMPLKEVLKDLSEMPDEIADILRAELFDYIENYIPEDFDGKFFIEAEPYDLDYLMNDPVGIDCGEDLLELAFNAAR